MKKESHSHYDLRAMARHAMINTGFLPDVPDAVIKEVQSLSEDQLPDYDPSTVRDLRSLLWSSIDNVESRDLDQLEYSEQLPDNEIRVMVAIADVDSFAPKNSAIDQYAEKNTTSVYTGVKTFPMLPERLSNEITSLLEDVDRLAVVMDLVVAKDGKVKSTDLYRAIVHNHARLAYDPVGDWLDGNAPTPPKVASTPGLEEQLRMQNEAAERLYTLRKRNGALNLETIEANTVARDGQVVGLEVKTKNAARYLIESLMIATNSATSAFLKVKGLPLIQRVVVTPKQWPRIVAIAEQSGYKLPAEPDSLELADFLARRKTVDPEHFPDLSLSVVKLLGAGQYMLIKPGEEVEKHFGLAVYNYTHSTAPNRRYADLIMQRLIKAACEEKPQPYSESELHEIAEHCEERENAARKVERLMRKAAAAVLLGERIGEKFDAIVTGVKTHGTFVRLITPPAEGRVVRGEEGLDVGDKVRVRLIATEPQHGFIDFERL